MTYKFKCCKKKLELNCSIKDYKPPKCEKCGKTMLRDWTAENTVIYIPMIHKA